MSGSRKEDIGAEGHAKGTAAAIIGYSIGLVGGQRAVMLITATLCMWAVMGSSNGSNG